YSHKVHTLYANILANSYDVLILTETWLISDIHDGEFIDDRYLVFRCDRDRLATKKCDGGGVLVAVRRELHPSQVTTQFNAAYLEHVLIRLPASQSNKQHIISAVYFPPNTPDHDLQRHYDLTNQLCYVVPRTVCRREVRLPRLFHTGTSRTNAGIRAPLRRLVDTYNSHFMDIDIFALSNMQFKGQVVKSLTETV
ncbi:hypothetical protein SFRURICE_000221, partial [Spodoptera frugiperda]